VNSQKTIDPVPAGTRAKAPEKSAFDTNLVVILLAEVYGNGIVYLREFMGL
jgi:hypothetical protein